MPARHSVPSEALWDCFFICNYQVTLNFVFFVPGNFHMLPSQKEMHGPRELEHVEKLKQDLLAKVKALGKELPLNTLDELINHFGGPDHVAEVLPTTKNGFRWGKGLAKGIFAGRGFPLLPCNQKKLLRSDFVSGAAAPGRALPSLTAPLLCADDGAQGPGGLQTRRLRHVRVSCGAGPLHRPRQPEGEGALHERGEGEWGWS